MLAGVNSAIAPKKSMTGSIMIRREGRGLVRNVARKLGPLESATTFAFCCWMLIISICFKDTFLGFIFFRLVRSWIILYLDFGLQKCPRLPLTANCTLKSLLAAFWWATFKSWLPWVTKFCWKTQQEFHLVDSPGCVWKGMISKIKTSPFYCYFNVPIAVMKWNLLPGWN